MANSYLNRTTGGSPTGATTWTYSAWLKRSSLSTSSSQKFFGAGSGSSDRTEFYLAGDSTFAIYKDVSGSSVNLASTRRFRDTNAWYHFVVQNNNGTVTVYVNNETVSLSGSNLGTNKINNASTAHYIGQQVAGGQFFDGYMSHVALVDGSIVAPTVFGETDSTSGIWKFKSPTGVTWGNNGFHLKFENSGALGTDSAGSNNWTVNGNLKQAVDNPSNVYATINPLSGYHGDKAVLEYGNNQLKSSTGGGAQWYGASTLAFTKGKFYCEVKNITTSNASLAVGISMNPARNQYENHSAGRRGTDIATENYSGNIVIANSNVAVGYMPTWSGSGDICMLAVDADNNKFYIGKNGTWADSDNPSNGTGGYDMSSVANHSESTGFYHFSFGSTSSSYMNSFSVNFGNGLFGITPITSAGSNGNGSLFEYDVPSGFYALNTKNLNTYG